MFDILIKQGFDLNILSLFRYKLDLKKDKIATITFLKDDIILNFQFFKNKLIIDSKNRYLDNFLNLIYKNLFKNIRFKNDFVDLYKYLQKKKISKQYMLFFIIFSNYINLEYFKIILLSFKEQYRDILFSYIRKNFNKITFLSVRKNDIVFFKSDKIYKASENILGFLYKIIYKDLSDLVCIPIGQVAGINEYDLLISCAKLSLNFEINIVKRINHHFVEKYDGIYYGIIAIDFVNENNGIKKGNENYMRNKDGKIKVIDLEQFKYGKIIEQPFYLFFRERIFSFDKLGEYLNLFLKDFIYRDILLDIEYSLQLYMQIGQIENRDFLHINYNKFKKLLLYFRNKYI